MWPSPRGSDLISVVIYILKSYPDAANIQRTPLQGTEGLRNCTWRKSSEYNGKVGREQANLSQIRVLVWFPNILFDKRWHDEIQFQVFFFFSLMINSSNFTFCQLWLCLILHVKNLWLHNIVKLAEGEKGWESWKEVAQRHENNVSFLSLVVFRK